MVRSGVVFFVAFVANLVHGRNGLVACPKQPEYSFATDLEATRLAFVNAANEVALEFVFLNGEAGKFEVEVELEARRALSLGDIFVLNGTAVVVDLGNATRASIDDGDTDPTPSSGFRSSVGALTMASAIYVSTNNLLVATAAALPVFAHGFTGETCDQFKGTARVAVPTGMCPVNITSTSVDFEPCTISTIQAVNSNPTGISYTVQGIVTADKRTGLISNKLKRGFWIQMTKIAAAQSTDSGSEGTFVYCGSKCTTDDAVQFKEGDLIQLTAPTSTYQGNPQLVPADLSSANVKVLCAKHSVELNNGFSMCQDVNVVRVTLPVASLDDYLPFKGMLVTPTETMTITDNYALRYGSLILSQGGRIMSETMEIAPGPAVADLEAANELRKLTLDDGLTATCPFPQLWPVGGEDSVRTGYTIDPLVLEGSVVLTFEFGAWTLVPNEFGSTYIPENIDQSSNPRVPTPPIDPNDLSQGDVRIASLNMLNYFVDFKDTCGDDCRGADNAAEFERQQRKLFHAIKEIDAAVFGLQELQQWNGTDSIITLVSNLNTFLGVANKYQYVNSGILGNDVIKVGIIYQPGLVEQVGTPANLTYIDPVDKSRPTVAQTFRLVGGTELFTVVVNHFKSKGSACDEDDSTSPDNVNVLYGEGNCGYTRLKHANQLRAWLIPTNPTGENTDKYILLGDLNSDRMERSITAFTGDDKFVNLANRDILNPYSHQFDGKFATLDYALASETLAPKCRQTYEWHINSDEAILTDYNEQQYSFPSACLVTKPASFFDETTPYRNSDHDPIITVCNFD